MTFYSTNLKSLTGLKDKCLSATIPPGTVLDWHYVKYSKYPKGDISIESDGETYTLFEVRIPNLELTSAELEQVYHKPDLTRLKSITSSEINLSEEKK